MFPVTDLLAFHQVQITKIFLFLGFPANCYVRLFNNTQMTSPSLEMQLITRFVTVRLIGQDPSEHSTLLRSTFLYLQLGRNVLCICAIWKNVTCFVSWMGFSEAQAQTAASADKAVVTMTMHKRVQGKAIIQTHKLIKGRISKIVLCLVQGMVYNIYF